MRFLSVAAPLVLAAGTTLTAWAQPAPGQGPAGPEEAGKSGEASLGLRPPKLKKFVEAAYPADKEKAGIEARVVLSIDVAESGHVGGVEVIASAGPDFDAAAVVAARQFEFEPATLDGTPVPVKIQYAYKFVVKEIMVSLGPQINLEGVITNRFTKTPQQGVKVRIVDLAVETTTDEDGAFAFTDVAPGLHTIELSSRELVTIKTEEQITRGKKKTVKYMVEPKEEDVDEEAVVRAPRIKKEVVETRVRTEEAKRVPGTQGDTLKVVQNLPGVGRSAFGSGALIVWGSAPQDTRVTVDGVEIPMMYHVGGMRSTINADMVRSIDLSPGSYGADYGRGLGGLVRIELQDPGGEGVHGYVAADDVDVSGMVKATITPQLRVAVSGRYGYLDQTLKRTVSSNVEDFFPIPKYDDYQARATYTLGKDEEIAATFLASDDHLQRAVPSSDPYEVKTQDTDQDYRRFIVRYTHLLPDGSSVVLTPSLGYDLNDSAWNYGGTPLVLNVSAWQYAVRGSYRRKVASSVVLSLGMDFQGRSSVVDRVGSLELPAREGDIAVFGQPPGTDLAVDHWKVNMLSMAPYAFAEITLGRWTLIPGFRLEPTLIDGNLELPHSYTRADLGYRRMDLPRNPLPGPLAYMPNPRLSVVYRASPKLTLTGGTGIYGQPPLPEDLSPVFGNPSLGSSTALHTSLGASYKLAGTLTLETIGYYKRLYDLVARSELISPPVGQALVQTGIGSVYGGQVLLRQELAKGFFGWLTYSISRSERKDGPDTAWRLFDYDQTNVLAVLASYEITRGFQAGARFRYTTGAPRTPVIGAYFNTSAQVYEPIFGAQNSIRLPAFYALDVRVEKSFVYQRMKFNLFADVQNVTNRKNPEEIIYSANFSQHSYITGLPILPVVGARVEY
jgi:TonB family protein